MDQSENDEGSLPEEQRSEHAIKSSRRDSYEMKLQDMMSGMLPRGDTTSDKTHLRPIRGSKEFAPLSLKEIPPGAVPTPLSDSFTLERETPQRPGQERKEKSLDNLVPESESMIKTGLYQTRHIGAITAELRLLLENEKKILDQVTKRCLKFTALKEENKLKSDEWFKENRQRLLKFDGNLAALANFAEDIEAANEEDASQGEIKQKILSEILHKTAEVANDITVQLSIEETIINDVDLSLSGLKKHALVMDRLMSSWMRMLDTLDQHQAEMLDRWMRIRRGLREMKEKSRVEGTMAGTGTQGVSSKQIENIVKGYDSRIKRLEELYSELHAQCFR